MDSAETKDSAEAQAAVAERTAPHNPDVEAGLIGAVLRNNELLDDMLEVTPEMFYVPGHRKLWEIITSQHKQGHQVTPATIRHLIEGIEEIEGLGGARYIGKLSFEIYAIVEPKLYHQILTDLYLKRELIDICTDGMLAAYDNANDLTANDLRDQTETRLFELDTGSATSRRKSLEDASKLALEEIERTVKGERDQGVPSGFSALETNLGRMMPSDLLIIAARPGMGKTSFAIDIALNAARHFHRQKIEKSVLFFSLEMAAEQISSRILSAEAGIKHEKLRVANGLNASDLARYQKAQRAIAPYPLYLEDESDIHIAEMRTQIRRLSRKHPVGLVFVDYLQLMTSKSRRREENRVQEVSEITRGLKLLAREYDIPVVALSQLSRRVEQRDPEGGMPILSDLRDSGSIEQDADVVLFLYRPEYYLKQQGSPGRKEMDTDEGFQKRKEKYEKRLEEAKDVVKLGIAKNRHGATVTCTLHFNADLIHFSDALPQERNYRDTHGTPR